MARAIQARGLGAKVHYRSFGSPAGEYKSLCRTADVVEVGGWITDPDQRTIPEVDGATRTQTWHASAAALIVENPTGLFFNTCPRGVPVYADGDTGPSAVPSYEGGTWHPSDECGPR